jgi:peptidoglycan/LPS O-acetylase OafA/YrhL
MFGETKYRKDVQVMRGLAVLAVVLFHANESYFPLGYLGVDVFFVISGFVVYPLVLRIFTEKSEKKGRVIWNNLKDFYKRRFYRLAPAMLLMLTLSAILFILFVSPSSFKTFGEQTIDTIFFLGNYGAFKNVGDYFNNSGNPLVHTWSLAVEEQIYIFLPVVMFIFLNRAKNVLKISILVMFVITSVSLFLFMSPSILQPIYDKLGISDSGNIFFYSPLHRIWQFALGGIGYLLTRNSNLPKKEKHFVNYILILCLLAVLFLSPPLGPRSGSLIASLLSILIICLRSFDSLKSKVKLPFEWLGDRSYSVYLFHMPLISIAISSPYLSRFNSNGIFIIIAVFLSILFGALSYSKVENRYRIRKHSSNNQKSPFRFVTLFLTLSLLLSVFMIKGSNNLYFGLQEKIIQPPVAWELDSNCARMSGEDEPACFYETKGARKTVLLIGDSHAAQFSQAIIDASQRANWNSVIWTMASCNFALTQKSGSIPQPCMKRNNSILNWINEYRPDSVIVSQYNRIELPQREMKSALLLVKKLTPNVLILGNTPVFPDKNYMSSPALFQRQYEPSKKILRANMDNRNTAISNTFLNDMAKEGLEIANLNSLWCELNYCHRFSKKSWLFFDATHLSVSGANLSVPFFTSYLNNL